MPVGNMANEATINNALGGAAVSLRKAMEQARDMYTFVSNAGTSGLEAYGFSAQDAATVTTLASYLSTLAGCYYGTVQQGGSGGSGAALFNFDNALSVTWGGQ